MARTRRAQVLMEPEEYAILERLAEERGVSVSDLIRAAVRETYLSVAHSGQGYVDDIAAMNVPIGDWEEIEREIEEGHRAGVS